MTAMPTVAALWRGDLPLPKIVWFYGFMGSIVLALPINLTTIAGAPRSNAVMLFYCVIIVAYTIFVCISIWKAASRYHGFFFWPLISKLSVAIVLAVMVGGFLSGFVS